MRKKKTISRPAIIIAAFGSSRRGKKALDQYNAEVTEKYPGYAIYWAFTSAIIRKKTGNPGLSETLAAVAENGYATVAVLPLQIFPGSEYRKIKDTATCFPGIKAAVGETLMHRSSYFSEVLKIVEKDFLQPSEGLNLIALHGTPSIDDPVNSIYLGLEKHLGERYENVFATSLEGLPNRNAVFQEISELKHVNEKRRIRIIPFMYTAGMHVEEDLMGGPNSWKNQLSQKGFSVECLTVQMDGEKFFKSLASYTHIQQIFLQRLARTVKLAEGF